MEDPGPLILDISSDDDSSFGDGRKEGMYGFGRGEFTDEDCYWLTRLLDEVDGSKDDDDSDDVVVVSEVCAKSSRKSRLESLKQSAKVGNLSKDDGDDDCVVLDGDPDKPAAVVNAKVDDNKDKDNDLGDDSDDLEIVGEKGEVACRDFPHARHLCVKFVFASTPHKAHCSQCHCYVCDSLAPCSQWGDGLSTDDHCNANDKEEFWRVERKRMKKGGKPMPVNPFPIIPTTGDNCENYLSEVVLQTPRGSVLPQCNSFLPNTVFRPHVPAPVHRSRIRSVQVHNPPLDFVPLQLHRTHNNSVPSRSETNNAGSRNAHAFTPLKTQTNRNVSGSLPHRNLHPRYHPFMPTVRHGSASHMGMGRQTVPPVLPQAMPFLPVGHTNYLSSQPPMHSSSYSSSRDRDPILPQPQIPSQPFSISDFGSSSHLQLKLPSQPCMENLISLRSPNAFHPNSPFPSPTLSPHQSDSVSAFGNQLRTNSMISSHPNVGNNFESQLSQSQAHFSSSNLLIDALNDIQYVSHPQGALVTSPTDFGINCGPPFGCGNQVFDAEVSQQVAPPAESSRLSSEFLPKYDDHRPVEATTENSQPLGLEDGSSQRNGTLCHFTESTKSDLNLHLDNNWMFENDSFPGTLEVPLSPGWNEFSPGAASIGIETGTLFDI